MNGQRSAVFLDRDGVLNAAVVRDGKPYPPACVADLKIPPGVIESSKQLDSAGFLLIGITNQPDVVRGTTRREVVEEINTALRAVIPLHEILVCYHDDADQCECRKPKPGLILEAARKYSIELASSFMIGDRWKDIEAGRRAGCRTIFINRGYAERGPEPPADFTTHSFSDAAAWILSVAEQSGGST